MRVRGGRVGDWVWVRELRAGGGGGVRGRKGVSNRFQNRFVDNGTISVKTTAEVTAVNIYRKPSEPAGHWPRSICSTTTSEMTAQNFWRKASRPASPWPRSICDLILSQKPPKLSFAPLRPRI